MIAQLAKFAHYINCMNKWLGYGFAWLTLGVVLLTFIIVVMRYLFNFGSIALQELVLYMHAGVFLVGAAYAMQQDGHVRVDIFYRNWPIKLRAWVDLCGVILLLTPLCLFIFMMSWDYVVQSWLQLESSREAGGLGGVFLLKSLIPLFALLILLQGFATAVRCLAIVLDRSQIAQRLAEHTPPHESF